jgi:hypothetical protein
VHALASAKVNIANQQSTFTISITQENENTNMMIQKDDTHHVLSIHAGATFHKRTHDINITLDSGENERSAPALCENTATARVRIYTPNPRSKPHARNS